MSLNLWLYEAIIPKGTPTAKHKVTETKTEDKVIMDWVQIPHAPINNSNNIVTTANLNPTVKYPIAVNIPIVYHHGICVKKVSRGLSRFKYTNALNPFVNAINEGLTVKDYTVSAIGCLIESFHSDGNDPILTTKASIKTIIKKTIKDGIK